MALVPSTSLEGGDRNDCRGEKPLAPNMGEMRDGREAKMEGRKSLLVLRRRFADPAGGSSMPGVGVGVKVLQRATTAKEVLLLASAGEGGVCAVESCCSPPVEVRMGGLAVELEAKESRTFLPPPTAAPPEMALSFLSLFMRSLAMATSFCAPVIVEEMKARKSVAKRPREKMKAM